MVHPKENVYLALMLLASLFIYLALVITIIGIFYSLLGLLIAFVTHGLFIGNIKGNGVRVSEEQFPEVYRSAEEMARRMGLDTTPAIYVLQSGGMLNALATCFLGRNFVIVYSDVLELAYAEGEVALNFVLAHELTHIKRRHMTWRYLFYPAMMVPFLGSAYSRACEYTCDLNAAHIQPDGALSGLLVLAAGKRLYRRANADELMRQVWEERGFWFWFAEICASHPYLCHRIGYLHREVEVWGLRWGWG